MIKIGIIGYGKMGKIRETAIEHCGGEVIAIYEKEDFEHDKKVNDLESIFNNDKINTVFICTPNFLNKEYTIKALQHGKNVFCEKPPTLTVEEMNEILAEEAKHSVKLMYGFNHRHHDSVIKIKEIVNSREYGKILWMRGRYGKNVDESFFKNWRAKKELSGGGILIDQGIHMLDLFLYMAGEFDDIKATVSNEYWKIDGIEDNVFAIFKNHKKGISASLHSTMTQWRHLFSFEMFFEGGYVTLNGLKTPSGAYGKEVLTLAKNKSHTCTEREYEIDYEYKIDNSWDNEVRYFFDAIKNNNEIEIGNSSDAMKIMQTIEKIYENGR